MLSLRDELTKFCEKLKEKIHDLKETTPGNYAVEAEMRLGLVDRGNADDDAFSHRSEKNLEFDDKLAITSIGDDMVCYNVEAHPDTPTTPPKFDVGVTWPSMEAIRLNLVQNGFTEMEEKSITVEVTVDAEKNRFVQVSDLRGVHHYSEKKEEVFDKSGNSFNHFFALPLRQRDVKFAVNTETPQESGETVKEKWKRFIEESSGEEYRARDRHRYIYNSDRLPHVEVHTTIVRTVDKNNDIIAIRTKEDFRSPDPNCRFEVEVEIKEESLEMWREERVSTSTIVDNIIGIILLIDSPKRYYFEPSMEPQEGSYENITRLFGNPPMSYIPARKKNLHEMLQGENVEVTRLKKGYRFILRCDKENRIQLLSEKLDLFYASPRFNNAGGWKYLKGTSKTCVVDAELMWEQGSVVIYINSVILGNLSAKADTLEKKSSENILTGDARLIMKRWKYPSAIGSIELTDDDAGFLLRKTNSKGGIVYYQYPLKENRIVVAPFYHAEEISVIRTNYGVRDLPLGFEHGMVSGLERRLSPGENVTSTVMVYKEGAWRILFRAPSFLGRQTPFPLYKEISDSLRDNLTTSEFVATVAMFSKNSVVITPMVISMLHVNADITLFRSMYDGLKPSDDEKTRASDEDVDAEDFSPKRKAQKTDSDSDSSE